MSTTDKNQHTIGTSRVKRGMAEMLKGGVIMDVVNAEQAQIAEDSGAVAVMHWNESQLISVPRRRCKNV